ncbi:amidophosphoribosyltransferase [Bacteroidetes/Chlorobi group bacterium Naka2016]|jgi:amidophosphoribosyltransferase|nr:MAG: amidophosphoribosyltransferase [Bacteroidetes/Chlorobi group bacterium Naka2016]
MKREEIDKPRSNCGVVGVFNHPEASIITYYALHSLQHRGQEAAGIVSFFFDEKSGKKKYAIHRGEGLVLDVFQDPKILTEVLIGDSAVGHNRYSTTGSAKRVNIQPFVMTYHSGILAISHNGNLTNTLELRRKLSEGGAIFQTTTDTEIFLHLIAHSRKKDVVEQVLEALRIVRGAYSIVILTQDSLIAARDPYGFRPLSIGKLKTNNGDAYIVASETCAFDIVNAEYIRSLEHNELVVIDRNTVETGEIKSYSIQDIKPEARHCIFEYIYFSRPDSKIFNHNVDKVRRKLGKNLAEESPLKKPEDKVIVISVPDSGNTAALGYARVNNEQGQQTAFEIGLIRSHYVGRTFIAPSQDKREFRVKVKFNTVKGVLKDRVVVVVDDSIVRGTTSKALIKLIREAEPKEVHMRITSPPIRFPCHYGMDFPSKEELIANYYNTEEEIGKEIGADSLHYLSLEKLLESVPKDPGIGYCTACFTGEYPVPIEKNHNKFSIEL